MADKFGHYMLQHVHRFCKTCLHYDSQKRLTRCKKQLLPLIEDNDGDHLDLKCIARESKWKNGSE